MVYIHHAFNLKYCLKNGEPYNQFLILIAKVYTIDKLLCVFVMRQMTNDVRVEYSGQNASFSACRP